jgi:hypothetical protein
MRESIELARAVAIIRKLICTMFNTWLTKVEEYDKDIAKCFHKNTIPMKLKISI